MIGRAASELFAGRGSLVLGLTTLVLLIPFSGCREEVTPIQASEETAATDPRPTPIPDRIVLTWESDPATSQSFNWRTDSGFPEGFVEIAPAEASPRFMLNRRRYPAVFETVETDSGRARFHSATVAELSPDTLYAYRVGGGEIWSEWFQFRTAAQEFQPFSFIYFGDAQNNLLSLWSRSIRTAVLEAPKARFMIHAGDLVNRANRDSEWGEWFEAGDWLHATIPAVPVPGNHEYTRGEDDVRRLDPLWRHHFKLPDGPVSGLEETVYAVDFQGLRIIGLNSNEEREEQAAWLEEVLSENPNLWTIVTFHHPIYSSARGRDNEELRTLWQPLFERYGVDLVLQGHDHTYARGANLPFGVSRQDLPSGPVYVVSVSGPKMYRLSSEEWWDRAAENTQLFQVIGVNEDRLEYRAFTATGELYDAFDWVRQEDGSKTMVEQVEGDWPLRLHSNTLGGLPPE